MNLAAVLGFCVFSVGWLPHPASEFVHREQPALLVIPSLLRHQAGTSPGAPSSSGSQAPAAEPAGSPKAPAQTHPAITANKSTKSRKHPKKAIYSDCSNAPTALNPAPGSANGTSAENVGQSKSNSAAPVAAKSDSGTGAKQTASPKARPCAPRRKVVRNGGADEPRIELEGGTPAQQASSARSAEEINSATEENLNKLQGRQLDSNQMQTMSQIRQFMEESRKAVAAGDPERAQNLATKARLLSEELLKP